ncbi:hypothetical protein V6N12_002123 [Hibiscus sabdariffa]|uniref:Uncharacterized protein n=1 Tax=Hibiscus sabdariffa TaxID=183260 RepID=A0ABR2B1P2_9ROSI
MSACLRAAWLTGGCCASRESDWPPLGGVLQHSRALRFPRLDVGLSRALRFPRLGVGLAAVLAFGAIWVLSCFASFSLTWCTGVELVL